MTFHKCKTNHCLLSALTATMLLSGCASAPENDPWQGWNHGAQAFNDTLDKHVVKPLAQGYEWVTPQFVDDSITHAFSNVNDIGVTINDFLQFKLMQGGMDLGRFLVNSTVGLGGLIDAGEWMGLPKHNEDFGQTLAVWGVPAGPYLVLPIYGESSPRDTFGLVGDALMNPLTYVSIFGGTDAVAATSGSRVLEVIDKRAQLLSTERVVNEATGQDRYEFLKNAYQQRRNYLINDGKTDSSDLDKELDSLDKDDKAPATQP